MSKKIWNKIFKSKSQKKPTIAAIATNATKRCSIYEEYQQLNALVNNDKENTEKKNNKQQSTKTTTAKKLQIFNEQFKVDAVATDTSDTNSNLRPQQQQQQQQSQQSTFSKVVNTLTLKRRDAKCCGNSNTTELQQTQSNNKQQPEPEPEPNDKYYINYYNTLASLEEPVVASSLELTPCSICSRKFNPDTLKKHIVICEKMQAKKRKPFDSKRQRREGTDLADYLPKNFGVPNKAEAAESRKAPESPAMPRKNKPEESARPAARASTRKAPPKQEVEEPVPPSPAPSRAAAKSKAKPEPEPEPEPPKPKAAPAKPAAKRSLAPASEQCPHCERSFGLKAFDRHVEWCKEKALQQAMKQSPAEKQKAKQKLEMRTKYRAPNLKTKRSLNREKYSGNGDDDAEDSPKPQTAKSDIMSLSMTSSVASESGQPTDYDPFLFAKRQLEDLCSPQADTDPELTTNNKASSQQTQPQTPIQPQPRRRLQSLQSSHEPTTPNPPTTTSSSTSSSTKANISNFRRTSSLRAPRRSPMLVSRPFFAQPQRQTIQRGLSDEGPISTNFLKPEEYDEMPVRSVCQNDFAITNSPRLVRRDTSASNRKNSLKLQLNTAATTAQAALQAGANSLNLRDSSEERLVGGGHNARASKYFNKTDSLAVFLKYEQDLEKLQALTQNTPTTKHERSRSPSPSQNQPNPPQPTPLQQQATNKHSPSDKDDSPLISKELKDKSNTLSKQNSAKSITTESNTNSGELPSLQKPPVMELNKLNLNNSHNNNTNNKMSQIRLEPISKPSTPLTKPSTPPVRPHTASYLSFSKDNNQHYNSTTTPKLPAVQHTPISLSALHCETKTSNYLFHKERQLSECSDYIDPKLINKCDNLPMNLAALQSVRNIVPNNDSMSAIQCNGGVVGDSTSTSSASNSSSECSNAPPVSAKLMPISRDQHTTHNQLHTQQQQQLQHQQQLTHSSSTNSTTTHSSTASQRNSAEGRNLLKRKMRLGRNQFLYDASPEAADSCSADDEANNRSSVEYEDVDHQQPQLPFQISRRSTLRGNSLQAADTGRDIRAPLDFDNFDFEDFLAKFESGDDDEQFPLFKDCREFLMNRTFNNHRQRSLNAQAQLTKSPSNINTQASTPTPTTPLYSPSVHAMASHRFNSETHFPFTNIKTNPNPLSPLNYLTSAAPLKTSNINNNNTSSFLHQRRQVDSNTSQNYDYNNDDAYNNNNVNNNNNISNNSDDTNGHDTGDGDQKKREIFISIETEQNDLVSSPNALRNMMGNPNSVIELGDADASVDNFSKITDDDINQQQQQQPNVQLNNAKNLIQKMQDDFRQLGEEVGADLRQAVYNETMRNNTANNNCPGTAGNSSANSPIGGLVLGESDEMSSLDSFPIEGQSSRQLGSKMSADSAYGSLSRQRSSELSVPRTGRRPATANMPQPNFYPNDGSLPPIGGYNNGFLPQPQPFLDPRSANNSSSSLSQSMKMSKFCHECGSKFVVEQAKFCMDCGVKRIML